MNNRKYAEHEVELATDLLNANQNDQKQKDRLAYWLAFLGRFEEADQIEVTSKTESLINERRNSLSV
jgi:hypothetical protein